MCYLEFGRDLVGRMDVTLVCAQAPGGEFEGPSQALAADKGEFGSHRIERWFHRTWTTVA